MAPAGGDRDRFPGYALGLGWLASLVLAPSRSPQFLEGCAARVHPSLPPGALRSVWASRRGRGLLTGACLVWLVLAALLTAATLTVAGAGPEAVVWGTLYGVLLGAAGTVVVSCTLGLGCAMPGGLAIAPAFGLAFGVALEKAGGVAAFAAAFDHLSAVAAIAAGPAGVAALGPLAGAIVSVGVGASGYFAGSPFLERGEFSVGRQVAGTVIGVFASTATYGLAVAVALWLYRSGATVAEVCALLGGLVGAGLASAMLVRGVALRTALALAAAIAVPWTGLAWMARAPFVDSPVAVLAAGMCTAGFYSTFFALSFALAERYGGAQAGAVASAAGSGGAFVAFAAAMRDDVSLPVALSLTLLGVAIGLAFPRIFPLITYPFECAWNVAIYRVEERRSGSQRPLLRLNSAFWNELQWLPLPGLAAHLLLQFERGDPDAGPALRAIGESRQRRAASAVQIELDARGIEACRDVEAIRQLHPRLETVDRDSPLRAFLYLSRDVEAAMSQSNEYYRRLALERVGRDLDFYIQNFTRAGDPVSARFLPGLWRWREIVQEFRDRSASLEHTRDRLLNPFVPGLPLTEQEAVFVGRTELSAKIAAYLMAGNAPPLLLYGQRRMGKTSLLNNLRRLLPSTIVPVFADLQGIAVAENDAGFAYSLHRAMAKGLEKEFGSAVPRLPRQEFQADPYSRLDEWFDDLDGLADGRKLLLALDELEALDRAAADGRVREEGAASLLRHLVQHRRNWRLLVAASHSIKGLRNWASRLINLQTIPIGYLEPEEARRLIEAPIKDFALRYAPGAVERIYEATRGHPWLLQQVCWELVELKNSQDASGRALATLADVECAFSQALEHGYFVFADMRSRLTAQAEGVLRWMARQAAPVSSDELEQRFEDRLDEALELLVERELVERLGHAYRVQVELVRRWFAEADGEAAHPPGARG